MNLIDLAAVLPFWAILFMKISNPGSSANGNFGFVRVIRLVRVFRVFKFGRYSIGLQMFAGALKGSVQPMGILIFVMSINMIILSSIVHIVELAIPDEDQSDMHKRCFGTISRTFWWAMVTMTTVGYGDCSPLSALGKTIAVVAMLSGVLILALPITVIGSNFAKMVEMFEDVRPAPRRAAPRRAAPRRREASATHDAPHTTHAPHAVHHTPRFTHHTTRPHNRTPQPTQPTQPTHLTLLTARS